MKIVSREILPQDGVKQFIVYLMDNNNNPLKSEICRYDDKELVVSKIKDNYHLTDNNVVTYDEYLLEKLKATQHPLILVFYINKEDINSKDVMNTYIDTINYALNAKESNALAFFLPTDGEDRVECLNPVQLSYEDMGKVDRIVNELRTGFNI
jgi:hypothetical protein